MRPLTDRNKEDEMDWLEKVWIEVQDEIDYEAEHPQDDDEWLGTSMYPQDAPK
jgi:hypothetical protein